MRSFKRTKPSHFVARTVPSERRSSLGSQLANYANLSGGNTAGISVTERSAMTIAAAYACINVIATDLASLPFTCFESRTGGGREAADDIAGAYLLEWSPDGEGFDDTTSYKFRQDWIAHALGWGNGFASITMKGGEPARLDLLDPSKWRGVRRQKDRRLYYVNVDDPNDTRLASEVMHLAALGFDGISGYSPIKLHKQGLALGLAAETFGASFFGNGSTVSGWLKHPRTLNLDAKRNLVESLEMMHQGSKRAHRIGVLEEGMDFLKTSVDPDDAQFLATRQFQVIEVCRMYRVPPHKVGDYSQSHLANVEASNLDYIISTLRPWAVAMEKVASLRLLTPEQRRAGYYFEHQLTALLRGDMKARGDYYQRMRDLGSMTPDEIRASESLNPLEGGIGKTVLVPANFVPLKKIASGEWPATPAKPATETQSPAEKPAPDESEGEPTVGD